MTIQLTLAANAIGLVFGFVVALLVLSKVALIRLPAVAFVEFFRCTPAIVQIVWFFYCVPMLFNVYLGSMTMGILALGLNLAAFNGEAYRASIQSVPKEHRDAAVALGLSPIQSTLHIILPTALRLSVPVLLTNGIVIFQQSALVAIVAVPDLMYEAKSFATQTYRPIETFTLVALVYFAVSFPISHLVGWLERRRTVAMACGGRHGTRLSILPRFAGALGYGLWLTVRLTLICIITGGILGFLLALAHRSKSRLLRAASTLYVEIFRGTPVLIQLIWIFFCLLIILGVELSSFVSGVIALTLYTGAIASETFRSSLGTVGREQMDACVALGLPNRVRVTSVILPQALLRAAPTLLSNAISLFK